MDTLYQAHILDHCKHPHNKGEIKDPDIICKGKNVSCGDDLTWYLRWSERGGALRVSTISFDGYGCAISQAGASMLSDLLIGKTADEIAAFSREDMIGLLHVDVSHMREKCALLPLRTIQEGIIPRVV
jgi:nitrogen fixation NifU-like protein